MLNTICGLNTMQVLNTKTNIYPTEKALQHHITHKQSAPGPAHMRSSKG